LLAEGVERATTKEFNIGFHIKIAKPPVFNRETSKDYYMYRED